MMKQYIIVKSRTVDELNKIVNDNIAKGYAPIGAFTMSQDYPVDIVQGHVRLGIEQGMMFFQAMTTKDYEITISAARLDGERTGYVKALDAAIYEAKNSLRLLSVEQLEVMKSDYLKEQNGKQD